MKPNLHLNVNAAVHGTSRHSHFRYFWMTWTPWLGSVFSIYWYFSMCRFLILIIVSISLFLIYLYISLSYFLFTTTFPSYLFSSSFLYRDSVKTSVLPHLSFNCAYLLYCHNYCWIQKQTGHFHIIFFRSFWVSSICNRIRSLHRDGTLREL